MRGHILLLVLVAGCSAAPSLKTEHNIPTYTNKFLIVGDHGHTSRSGAQRIANQMEIWAERNGADFILSLGDNFYQDGPSSVSDSLFDSRWKDVYTGKNIKDLLWFISVGNHDYYPYEGFEWNEVLRTQTPGEKRWYLPWLWYNHTLSSPAGDLDLIVTDTQAARKGLNDHRTMYKWFEDTVKWSSSKNNMQIIVGHHPCYSAGNYYLGSSTCHKNYEPVMRNYNSEFYLSGHDHNMQHISYKNGRGPEYLIIGGGGAGLYSQDSAAASGLSSRGLDIKYFKKTYGFAGCTINSNGITMEYFDDYGKSLYRTTKPSRRNGKQ